MSGPWSRQAIYTARAALRPSQSGAGIEPENTEDSDAELYEDARPEIMKTDWIGPITVSLEVWEMRSNIREQSISWDYTANSSPQWNPSYISVRWAPFVQKLVYI
ncbi:hypothetical protein V8E54_006309 [Elaphomyces granulatus]